MHRTLNPTASQSQFALDVAAGLSARPKRIPSCHFYDERGSELFRRITELDEYYLTGCEREILRRHGETIGRRMPDGPFRLVELGAGDGSKTEILLDRFARLGSALRYTPVDICPEIIDQLVGRMRQRFNSLPIEPLVGDYFDALDRLRSDDDVPSLCLFLGSSIGNFRPRQAARFLRRVSRALRPGDLLLVGFDLKKDAAVLRRAYDDSLGVTREFNFNLLDRINRELDADFDRARFDHHCHYNAAQGRMESWLLSTQAQRVNVGALGRRFSFAAWEGIHLECSYKYDMEQIADYAAAAGFSVVDHYFDARRYFVDTLWRVRPR
jgi:dimethylhistidine N-methyltransferase